VAGVLKPLSRFSTCAERVASNSWYLAFVPALERNRALVDSLGFVNRLPAIESLENAVLSAGVGVSKPPCLRYWKGSQEYEPEVFQALGLHALSFTGDWRHE
jgi:hypothetical protein